MLIGPRDDGFLLTCINELVQQGAAGNEANCRPTNGFSLRKKNPETTDTVKGPFTRTMKTRRATSPATQSDTIRKNLFFFARRRRRHKAKRLEKIYCCRATSRQAMQQNFLLSCKYPFRSTYTDIDFCVAPCHAMSRDQIRTDPDCISHCVARHRVTQNLLFV
jgi:hypothetical protein